MTTEMPQPSVHPDIRDLPMGNMMAFPKDIDLPEGWRECDGSTVYENEAATFVWFMYNQFGDGAYDKPFNLVEQALRTELRKRGFRAHKNRTVLPDFRGRESETAFGADITGIDVRIAMKVGR